MLSSYLCVQRKHILFLNSVCVMCMLRKERNMLFRLQQCFLGGEYRNINQFLYVLWSYHTQCEANAILSYSFLPYTLNVNNNVPL
jgi:hypothetical protein